MKTAGERALDKGRKKIQEKSQALTELKIEYVGIDTIKPNSYNPNRQSKRDFELLCRSIEEDGFTQPIIVHRSSMMIVDGEHRWRAARDMGMPQVPVVFVDMTDEQMRISTLRHNRARGSEDVDLGSQVLRDLRDLGALDWAQDSLMLSDNELERLINDVPVASALAGETYSESWTPTWSTGGEDKSLDRTRNSTTDEARKIIEESTAKAAAATTSKERAEIEHGIRWYGIYRINVQFTDDDAALVRRVLEPHPAQKLYELCKVKWDLMPDDDEEESSGKAEEAAEG
jgi:hypothetical protein